MADLPLDALLPIRDVQIAGTSQPFAAHLDFQEGFTTTTTTNDDGSKTLHVIATGGDATHSGVDGMIDADFTVTENTGETYVGAGVAFTADRRVILPTNPALGKVVTWSDEVPNTTNVKGALATHNVIFDPGAGKEVMSGGTGNQGGNVLAATYTGTWGAWGAGASISVKWNGSFWKVI